MSRLKCIGRPLALGVRMLELMQEPVFGERREILQEIHQVLNEKQHFFLFSIFPPGRDQYF
jgi:hypothetical protein